MKRRAFLELGAAAGAATILPRAVPGPRPEQLAALAGERGGSRTRESDPGGDLDEITVAGIQAAMEAGALTARRITEHYLARIEAIDRNGPELRAVIEVNPDVLAIADRLDAERAAGRARGPLHGIPVLLKDNIDTADRLRTSAGSLALADRSAAADAPLVRRLRDAGAVILGKTNLSEWANFRSTHSTSGWSGRGGQTRNPYALDRNPCGSSSGSAVAVSANLAALAIGTETDGSIVCPASTCGIVGIKPTRGLVSREGIVPISHSQDTAGPMARTVGDAAIGLGVLGDRDYTPHLNATTLRGARLGVARNFFGANAEADAVMEDALRAIRDAGGHLVDPVNLTTASELGRPEFEVLLYEFKADLNAYLATLGPAAPARSLAALIEFNIKNREREMPFFGQEIFIQAEAKGPLTEKAYRAARAACRRLARDRGIDRAVRDHRLDAILAPTGGPAWVTDLVNGDHSDGGSTSPAAVAGYPTVTVPAGFVFGLPVGLSFIGLAGHDLALIRLAQAFEEATKVRRKPEFLPTARLTRGTPGAAAPAGGH